VEAASEFYRRKDTVMAIALLDNLLQRLDITRDLKARALLLRGLIALETGKTSEAAVRFNAWIEQFPDRKEAAQVYLILGQCYRNCRPIPGAEAFTGR
jgi:outer membrane protein assembly factor BamD (BamD/ComL family)